MATATSLTGLGRQNAFDSVAASQTDSVLIAAVAGKKIRVIAAFVSCGATPSTVQFNSKPAGAGTAIGPVINNSISLPECQSGWFDTKLGEGLTVSTGAGSTSGLLVVYGLFT